MNGWLNVRIPSRRELCKSDPKISGQNRKYRHFRSAMKVRLMIPYFALLLVVGTLHAGNSGPTVDVKFGTVALTFDNSFDLEALGAKLNKVIPGSYRPGKKVVTAPIVGGAYKLSD